MLHFRCIDEVGYVKGHFRFLLYARYLLFFFFYTNTKYKGLDKCVGGFVQARILLPPSNFLIILNLELRQL